MAPGVSSGKRSAKVVHSRLYEGTSASQQVASMGADVRPPRAPQAWADPDIDYNKPWFEERRDAHGDLGFYCLLCSAWATDGHVSSDKHKSRADNPEWYGQYLRRGDSQAFDARFSRPWFESRDGEYYCRLCNAWATEGHVSSDRHKKREQYPEHYGFYVERPDGAGAACRGAAPAAQPPARNARCAAPHSEAYNELLREYQSKPWFELKDGEWYCNLCSSWATEGHLTGDKHVKRAMYPGWYGWNEAFSTAPLLSDRQAAAQRSESPLPAPWTRHFSQEHQRPYFHNNETGATTWERPGFPAVQDQPPPPPPDLEPAPAPRPVEREEEESPWQEFHDKNYNQPYYHNRRTGETTWTMPAALRQANLAQQAPSEPPRAAGAAAADPQEAEWEQHFDQQYQRHYWVNKVTKASQWETPPGFEDSNVDV